MIKAFSKIVLAVSFWLLAFSNAYAQTASLYLRPASGTYTVGSIFELGVYINTGGVNANAVKIYI